MYVDIVISNVFNLNKHFSFFITVLLIGMEENICDTNW